MAYRIPDGENPIATIVPDGGYTAIFRTLAVIGDSLASGEHESVDLNGVKGYHDYYEYSWGQFIARKCGVNVLNMSRGGLTAKTFHVLAQYDGCFTPEKACQGYIIGLGVNDATQIVQGDMEFGTTSDVETDNPDDNKSTFIGEYVKIIQRIRRLQPKARIFVITPPRTWKATPDKNAVLDKISDFLRSLPDLFEFLYVIDLRKYEPVYDKEFDEKYRLGGHLSAIGYKRAADVIATYIDYIIQHNPEDFKQVGFIGRDVYNTQEKW